MSVDYKILLMCDQFEDQDDIHRQLMDYFRIHEQAYVVFQPVAGQGFFCDYVKNLQKAEFVEYIKQMNWRNNDHVLLSVSSNGDPFEVCIAFPMLQ